jgi:predicted nucleic acid-binding protein
MIVVDTNVIVYCFVRGERTEVALRVRARDPEWHVPILWRSELRSALAGYVWTGMKLDRAMEIMAEAEKTLSGCEHVVASERVIELAARTRLSAYDCEFVALAQSLAVPLVTEDRAVLKAFPDLAQGMDDFLAGFTDIPPAAHERPARYRASSRGHRARVGR